MLGERYQQQHVFLLPLEKCTVLLLTSRLMCVMSSVRAGTAAHTSFKMFSHKARVGRFGQYDGGDEHQL